MAISLSFKQENRLLMVLPPLKWVWMPTTHVFETFTTNVFETFTKFLGIRYHNVDGAMVDVIVVGVDVVAT